MLLHRITNSTVFITMLFNVSVEDVAARKLINNVVTSATLLKLLLHTCLPIPLCMYKM